jgi:hypothetical protein
MNNRKQLPIHPIITNAPSPKLAAFSKAYLPVIFTKGETIGPQIGFRKFRWDGQTSSHDGEVPTLGPALPEQSHGGQAGQVGPCATVLRPPLVVFAKALETAASISRCLSCSTSFRILASTSAKSTSSTTISRQTVTAALPASSLTSYGTDQRVGDFQTGFPTNTFFDKSTRPLYVSS